MLKTNSISTNQKKTYRSLWPYAGLLLFILLLVLIWGIILNHYLAGNEMLFKKYYNSEVDAIELKSDSALHPSRLNEGIHLFAKGDHQSALIIFDEFPDHPTAMFCRSLSLIELGKPALAINDLETLMADSSNFYHDHAKWYRALLHLKLNQPTQARHLLSNMAGYPNIYKTKAMKLLEEIEK